MTTTINEIARDIVRQAELAQQLAKDSRPEVSRYARLVHSFALDLAEVARGGRDVVADDFQSAEPRPR